VEQWTATAALLAALLYLAAAARLRWRGDQWPVARQASFLTGCASIAAAMLAPLPGGPFTAHLAGHVLLGMAGPLLLVAGRPVTLALRALPTGRARRTVLAVSHSRIVAASIYPPVAAVLDIGGLWLLYRTTVFAASETRPWLHTVVHLHVVAAGILFSAAICQLDPVRRRYSFTFRAATLVAAGAAHSILAKSLWTLAPPQTDFTAGDVRFGAEIMYYGADAIEIALAVVVAVQWYTASGRQLRHQRRRRHLNSPVSPGSRNAQPHTG
jgi:putative membrane protein